MALLPIFALVIYITIIVGLLYLFSKIKIKKVGYWLLLGYTTILVISAIVYLFIPKDDIISATELWSEDGEIDLLYEVVYESQPIETYDRHKKNEWIIDVENLDELMIFYELEYNYSIPVIIELVNDQTKLEASFYQVSPKIDAVRQEGRDVVNVRLANEELIISAPSTNYFQFVSAKKEFPFNQFGESVPRVDLLEGFHSGQGIIYLKVPEHLDLQFANGVYYEYVN